MHIELSQHKVEVSDAAELLVSIHIKHVFGGAHWENFVIPHVNSFDHLCVIRT